MPLQLFSSSPSVVLAPLTYITDAPYREICRQFGVQYAFTEFVSTREFMREQLTATKNYSTSRIMFMTDAEPCGVQLRCFGIEDTKFTVEAITGGEYKGKYTQSPPMSIDLNMGCPSPNIIALNEGACFMQDIKRAEKVILAARKATNLPLSVKIRTGWDQTSINVVDFVKMIEACGADFVTVHGRTKEDWYKLNTNNLELIKAAKAAVNIPVLGNGDLFNAEAAKYMLDYCGVDGLMIARGSMGNPFIFQEILSYLKNTDYQEPNAEAFIQILLKHLQLQRQLKPWTNLATYRRICSMYIRHLSNKDVLAETVVTTKSVVDLIKSFEEISCLGVCVQKQFLGKL